MGGRRVNSCYVLGKLALHSADVLLLHESVPNLMFHLSCLFRRSSEQQKPAGQPIQTVDRSQIFQVVFFRQNKNYRVVPVPSARMYLIAVD